MIFQKKIIPLLLGSLVCTAAWAEEASSSTALDTNCGRAEQLDQLITQLDALDKKIDAVARHVKTSPVPDSTTLDPGEETTTAKIQGIREDVSRLRRIFESGEGSAFNNKLLALQNTMNTIQNNLQQMNSTILTIQNTLRQRA